MHKNKKRSKKQENSRFLSFFFFFRCSDASQKFVGKKTWLLLIGKTTVRNLLKNETPRLYCKKRLVKKNVSIEKTGRLIFLFFCSKNAHQLCEETKIIIFSITQWHLPTSQPFYFGSYIYGIKI